MSQQRKIIHIDMDAFFASVEQRDHPELRNRPVIVGGDPRGRGVVAACSYEARAFGIHSAMACARAIRLCPDAVFIPPDKEKYRQVSTQIMAIFHRYTDLVEPLSLDEAFLDVTRNHVGSPSATWLAEEIRKTIARQTGLTASAGVSCNKFLAKVASDMNKPDGMAVITPQQAMEFIHRLPVGKFYGVGRVTEKRMHALGIRTGADLYRRDRQELVAAFGRAGKFFYAIARGQDPRPVNPHRERKSIGTETTLRRDICEYDHMLRVVAELADKVAVTLAGKKIGGRTLTLKVRFQDFTTVTRSRTPGTVFHNATDIMAHVPSLLAMTGIGDQKVRLLGITISNLVKTTAAEASHGRHQLLLPFPDWPPVSTGV